MILKRWANRGFLSFAWNLATLPFDKWGRNSPRFKNPWILSLSKLILCLEHFVNMQVVGAVQLPQPNKSGDSILLRWIRKYPSIFVQKGGQRTFQTAALNSKIPVRKWPSTGTVGYGNGLANHGMQFLARLPPHQASDPMDLTAPALVIS